MAKVRVRSVLKGTVCLCVAFASVFASPVLAANKDATDSARAQVVILKPLGTRVAFDTISDALSGAFLDGLPGVAVSLVLPLRQRPVKVPVEVLVLSTDTYDLTGTLLASASRTKNGGSLVPAGYGLGNGSLLFLAQFN